MFFVDLGPGGPRPAATPERNRAKHTQGAWFCVPPSHAANRSNQGNLEAANEATSRKILGGRGRPGPGDVGDTGSLIITFSSFTSLWTSLGARADAQSAVRGTRSFVGVESSV